MLIIDTLIRYPTVAFLLLVALLCYRDGKNLPPAKYAALLCISLSAMLISFPQPELQLSGTPLFILTIIAIPNIIFVWWLGLSMFQEGFKPNLIHWSVLIVWIGIGSVDQLIYVEFISKPSFWMTAYNDYLVYGVMGHLLYITLSGRANDLIEPRRRLRLFFVIATVVGTLSIVTIEEMYFAEFASEVALFRAAVIFPLSLWGVLWLTKFHPEKLLFQTSLIENNPTNKIDPRDKLLKDQLIEQMTQHKIYLKQTLTIRSLASIMKTPEHRLRSLINQGLGFRNFSDFLNTYRLQSVKFAFKDPSKARLPILTIAMDAGYNSLAPFNRAFLKAEGTTPTLYRQNLLRSTDLN